jgi:multicomponent Na+:H+ antiporter subunit D
VATAFAVAGLRGGAQRVARVIGPLLALLAWSTLDPGASEHAWLGATELLALHVDPLSSLFGLAMCGMIALGSIYALHRRSATEAVAALVYAAGSLGVIFAGDWITLFAAWEVMAIASLFVVWAGGTRSAMGAGYRYLVVHGCGGALLLAGILVLAGEGSLRVGPLGPDVSPLAWTLILAGVALNAAVPPLHAWLTDAYPEASPTGSVFLSAFTTKTAVYLLIRVFPGTELLVYAGVVMALYGVVYAVLENDIRRLLGYHIISQVGYMVAAVGIGTPLALNGAAAHAYCHILYKALLFMGAGAVIHATGRRRLTELGGIGAALRWVVVLYGVGAVSISGFPLFNGFISKSMIISAAGEVHLGWAELLLTLASVGTFLHTGLKLPYFTFLGPTRRIPMERVPRNMYVAMALTAMGCFGLGVAPGLLYARLPYAAVYHPYTWDHVAQAAQLLLGTALAFWWLRPQLGGEATRSVDTDWIYRGLGPRLVSAGASWAAALSGAGRYAARELGQAAVGLARNPHRLDPFQLRRERSDAFDEDGSRLAIGATVFWIVVYFSVVTFVGLSNLTP